MYLTKEGVKGFIFISVKKCLGDLTHGYEQISI